MRIREKPDASEFLLIPANEEEQELMARIAAELAAGQAVNYDGRCADPDDSEYTCVKLYIGGRREGTTVPGGNLSENSARFEPG